MKKYWTHILNLVYLVFIDLFFGFLMFAVGNTDKVDDALMAILPVLLIIEAILSIVVFAEMIYAMIKAGQMDNLPNKPLHMVAIYMFNVFYIPCFMLKHMYKDEKYKVKNIAYLITSILLFVTLLVTYVTFVISNLD